MKLLNTTTQTYGRGELWGEILNSTTIRLTIKLIPLNPGGQWYREQTSYLSAANSSLNINGGMVSAAIHRYPVGTYETYINTLDVPINSILYASAAYKFLLGWSVSNGGGAGIQYYYNGPTNNGTGSLNLLNAINNAPNTPPTNNPKGTQASPATIITTTPTFSWSFSDPDTGDTQSAYQVRIKRASDNIIVHDSGKITSSEKQFSVPTGTIQKNTIYSWEVSVWDLAGIQSPYSGSEYFRLLEQATVGDKFTFAYTGDAQNFIVPGNVKKIKVELSGAQGGEHPQRPTSFGGGQGGKAWGDLSVTPGELMQVTVGGRGGEGSQKIGGSGGFNGGGSGGSANGTNANTGSGGGGGGATDIRRGGTALANRVLVAGGGGGEGSQHNGGAGGGLVGQNSTSGNSFGVSATGGTQTAGGVKGTGGSAGGDGALGLGGSGAPSPTGLMGGSGGGGGYYGGGGGNSETGAYVGNPGAGGSSYYAGLENSGTTTGGQTGNGMATITVLETTNPPTVTNRQPGTTDQLNPTGSNIMPLFSWDFASSFIQSHYQVRVFDLDNSLTHDSGKIASGSKNYQTPQNVLTAGKTYGWELTVTENGVDYPTNRIYFITNRPPGAPIPINPIDHYRTGLRPTFWSTIGDDLENDGQKFVIQIADNPEFTFGVQERSSETAVGGWQAKTIDGTYSDLTTEGVDSSFEGGTVKYTWSADLSEGQTYYWRMAGIDATTGSRSPWSDARRIRVGNKISMGLKAPVETSESIERLLIRAQFKLATDGATPATAKFEACNNAFDDVPTWEDVTEAVINDEYHNFTNHAKTAGEWGLNLRIQFEANDSLEPIELYGLGISFD